MNTKLKLILVFCLISQLVIGQPTPIDPPAEPDPAAPIDSWVIYLGIVGLLYSFLFFKKRLNIFKKD